MKYKRIFEENSYIFITVVTSKRHPILIKNIQILRKSFLEAKKFYPYELFAAVVLPDHFHLLIKPDNTKDYPSIIRVVKSYFSKNIDISKIKQ